MSSRRGAVKGQWFTHHKRAYFLFMPTKHSNGMEMLLIVYNTLRPLMNVKEFFQIHLAILQGYITV
jgi:hypothetical protein